MNVLDKCAGKKEDAEIRDWWLEMNGITTDPDKKGIISDEESRKNFLDYKRNEKELDYLFSLRESIIYGDMHENLKNKKERHHLILARRCENYSNSCENLRSRKIFIGFYSCQLSLS
ncbi:hypothetical protein HYU07_07040 [Candidatus Woesearchaeota archaeon]|nr:hypothetical protein [Candidatus Woesearchaeota archaeon]